jgi:4-amino-4-deoxy-L-arabinose transferase-like glycosyltransferase
MVIVAGIFKVFGTSLYTAKILPAVSGVCGILLTYLLGCELESMLLGILGAVFLAFDNMYVFASRTARPEAATTALMLVAVLLFLHGGRRQSLLLTFAAGLFTGMAGQSHPNGFAAGLIAGVLAWQEFGPSIYRRARPWIFVLGILVAMAPFLWWATSDAVHRSELITLYKTGEQYRLSQIPMLELSRYADFLGMPSSRLKLPVPLPYRLHVAAGLLAACFFLYRYNRRLFKLLLPMALACMFWWAYIRNQSVRYLATAAPYYSLILGGAAIALWNKRPAWRKQVVAVSVLLLAAEAGSNYFFLYLYRKADFAKLTQQFHALIPPEATVYGALPFWMAFPHQRFFSFNRTPLTYALDRGAGYLILNDYIMTAGNGFGLDDWHKVRVETSEFIRSGGATLIGKTPNPYYGDIEIYRVNQPKHVDGWVW